MEQRLSIQRLALAHSEWYANQITPSGVTRFIEQTLDKGYWQKDSPSDKLRIEVVSVAHRSIAPV